MKTLLRFSLEHNPLDDKTLDIIRKDGALALIEKDEMPSSGPKYKTLNHSKSSRSVQSSSSYHSNNNTALAANLTPTKPLNRRASTMLGKEKEIAESGGSNSSSEYPTDSAYRMRSRSTTVTDFSIPVIIAPPSPEPVSPGNPRNIRYFNFKYSSGTP